MMLLPGLTPFQQQRIADVLHRVGRVSLGELTPAYIDADRAAVRALDSRQARTPQAWPSTFVFGFAVGLRLGRGFVKPPRRSKHWISEDYRALAEHNRRTAARFIRQLLKAQAPNPSDLTRAYVPASEQAEIAHRWAQRTGALARKVR
jgi:hypothetical protein